MIHLANNIFNGSTNSLGRIVTQTVTEYTQNGSVDWGLNETCTTVLNTQNVTCFAPFNISVNHSTYIDNDLSTLINRSKFETLTLTDSIGSTTCGTLDQVGGIYKLTQSVASGATCFEIAANNITIDCVILTS